MCGSHSLDNLDDMRHSAHKVSIVTLQPGQLIAMHPFLIHGGGEYKPVGQAARRVNYAGEGFNWRGFGFVDRKVRTVIV